jgi:fluoride exporter
MKKYFYIAAGGMIGSLSRYGIKILVMFPGKWDFPFNTLMINLTGCFLIALVLAAAMDYLEVGAELRIGITTGFIGAFTTFSTLCRETFQLISSGHAAIGLLYAVLSVMLGLGAIFLGTASAHFLFAGKRGRMKREQTGEGGNTA